MLANVTGSARAPDKTGAGKASSPAGSDFTSTRTSDHHKMATAHDGKSLLLNHGGKMKPVKQVNRYIYIYVYYLWYIHTGMYVYYLCCRMIMSE